MGNKAKNIIAIDYGTKKSGLAYSIEGFAFGHGTFRKEELIPEILRIIKEKNIEIIVLGMPYHIAGGVSEHGKRVQNFQKELAKYTPFPIILHDERLSSSEAEMNILEDNVDSDIDTEAARLILESFITSSREKISSL